MGDEVYKESAGDKNKWPGAAKQIIHIISFEPITSKASANSFHELSMTSVSIDVIGEFWRQRKENWLMLSESKMGRLHGGTMQFLIVILLAPWAVMVLLSCHKYDRRR